MKFILLLLFPLNLFSAERIEFSQDELSRETVLPVFDKLEAVKKRNVETTGRFEFGANGGLLLNEALYTLLNFEFLGTYHLTESSAINVGYTIFGTGLTDNGSLLKANPGGKLPRTFDAELAPYPSSMLLANYQLKAYYGKISLSKQSVMNIILYFQAGGGLITIGDQSNLVVSAGMGQNFYFTDKISLNVNLLFYSYNGPDPISPLAGFPPQAGDAAKLYSEFEERLYINSKMTVGLSYLL